MKDRSRFCVSHFSVRVHVRSVRLKPDTTYEETTHKMRSRGVRSVRLQADRANRRTPNTEPNVNTNREPLERRSVNDGSLLTTSELWGQNAIRCVYFSINARRVSPGSRVSFQTM
jgi:hypothetical protein